MVLNSEVSNCYGPDFSDGYLEGSYYLNEIKTEKYSGVFCGEFHTELNMKDNEYYLSEGWYGKEGVSDFIGVWKSYKNSISKYCSWGLEIPPTKKEDLLRHYENESYLFNPVFLGKGWKTYVLANLNWLFIVPKDFYFKGKLSPSNLMVFSSKEIEYSIRIENKKWWDSLPKLPHQKNN